MSVAEQIILSLRDYTSAIDLAWSKKDLAVFDVINLAELVNNRVIIAPLPDIMGEFNE